MRQALERLACLLQAGGDLVRISPRCRIQPLGECVQRDTPCFIADALVDALADGHIPLGEKRDLFVRRSAGNRRWNWLRPISNGRWRGGRQGCGAGRCSRRRGRGFLTPRATTTLLDGRFDHLLVVANDLPLERDVWVARFDLAQNLRPERIASDAHASRCAERVQNARALTVPIAEPVHQVRGFVPPLVANHAQEGHGWPTGASVFSRNGTPISGPPSQRRVAPAPPSSFHWWRACAERRPPLRQADGQRATRQESWRGCATPQREEPPPWRPAAPPHVAPARWSGAPA